MKRQMLLCGAISLALFGWAESLSPDQALARALNTGQSFAKSRAMSDFVLSHTFRFDDLAVGYMFSTAQQGFLLVSADDIAAPTLGYSESQTFDADNIPDGLQYWLDSYGREIAWAKKQGIAVTDAGASRSDDHDAIKPLIATKWNQDNPYNELCPIIQGKRSVTGCVATAMAQVLNYYKYPAKGTGSITYKIDVQRDSYGNVVSGTDWSFDFANTTFDWDNMLDTYGENATDAQRKAVATLMSACGASVQMNYSPAESGAFSLYVPQALIKFFGYSNSAYFTERGNYTLEQWDELVYTQLKNNGPLLYNGVSDTGGHAFVCDGYNGDGYYHFNWGWGGMSDGYFRLNALDPSSQGIGGSTSGYNYQQGLVCDLRPSEGGERTFSLGLLDPFEIEQKTSRVGSNFVWSKGIVNYSSFDFSGYVNIAFEPVNGGDIIYASPARISNLSSIYPDGSMQYIEDVVTTVPVVDDGEYKLYPVWSRDSKDWKELLRPIYGNVYYTAKVKSKEVTFVAETKQMPDVTDVEITPLYLNNSFLMSGKVRNNASSEYYGRVSAHLMSVNDNSTDLFESHPIMIDLMAGEEAEFEIADELVIASGFTGAAKLVLVDELSGRQIGTAYDVTVKKSDATTSIEIGTIEYADGYSSDQNADDLGFKAKITCTGGYFAGTINMIIFPYENGEVMSVGYIQSDYISLEAGQSQEAVFKGSLANGIDDKEYFVSISFNNEWYGGELKFKLINKSSASDTITEDAGDMILYDLSGRRVQPESAPKGLYITKPAAGGKARKIVVK